MVRNFLQIDLKIQKGLFCLIWQQCKMLPKMLILIRSCTGVILIAKILH